MTHIGRNFHIATCPDCDGAGESVELHYTRDPQLEESVSCDKCGGSGEVEVWVDPLIRMKRAKWNRANGWYAVYRRQAMRPVSGLAMADMRAMATRCVTASDAAVAAWRRAAA